MKELTDGLHDTWSLADVVWDADALRAEEARPRTKQAAQRSSLL